MEKKKVKSKEQQGLFFITSCKDLATFASFHAFYFRRNMATSALQIIQEALLVSSWPKPKSALVDQTARREMGLVMEVISPSATCAAKLG